MALCFSGAFTADLGLWLPRIGFCLQESDIIRGHRRRRGGIQEFPQICVDFRSMVCRRGLLTLCFQVFSQRTGYLLPRNRLHLPRSNYMRGIGNSILRLRSNWNRVQCGSFLWWCFYTLIVEVIVWRFSMLFPHTDGHIWQSNLRMEIELRDVF